MISTTEVHIIEIAIAVVVLLENAFTDCFSTHVAIPGSAGVVLCSGLDQIKV